MFSKPLSALLVLVGLAVASVQTRVQDSDPISGIFSEKQAPLQYSTGTQPEVVNVWVDADHDPLQPNFEPIRELSALRSDQWAILRHPVFPRYSVRIKRSDFCDAT